MLIALVSWVVVVPVLAMGMALLISARRSTARHEPSGLSSELRLWAEEYEPEPRRQPPPPRTRSCACGLSREHQAVRRTRR